MRDARRARARNVRTLSSIKQTTQQKQTRKDERASTRRDPSLARAISRPRSHFSIAPWACRENLQTLAHFDEFEVKGPSCPASGWFMSNVRLSASSARQSRANHPEAARVVRLVLAICPWRLVTRAVLRLGVSRPRTRRRRVKPPSSSHPRTCRSARLKFLALKPHLSTVMVSSSSSRLAPRVVDHGTVREGHLVV